MKPMIFLAEGFEESEALLPLDILRRGGVDAITVSVSSDKVVKSSHGVQIVADAVMSEISADDVQMIILPGGLPGATNLDACAELDKLIMDFAAAGKPMAAICAAPMVYGKRGLLKGKKATCYPWKELNIQELWWNVWTISFLAKVRLQQQSSDSLSLKNWQEAKRLQK